MRCRIYDVECIAPNRCARLDCCTAGDVSPDDGVPCVNLDCIVGLIRCPSCNGGGSPLDTLARNLAIAGALCAAYKAGVNRVQWSGGYGYTEVWSPGCGRPAPGWRT